MQIDGIGFSYSSALVTGADGFIGSHLVDQLLEAGVSVTAIVRRTSRRQVTHRFDNLATAGRDSLKVVDADLTGISTQFLLGEQEADFWFHLAADAYVPASFSQPAEVCLTNIISTLNVLEAARRFKPAGLLVMSSSEVYGTHTGPINESCALNPTSPYAASKVSCDRLAWSYWESFGVALTIARPFNTYGPRHIYDVVPKFIQLALAGAPLTIHGDGSQTRDLTYVNDTVRALIALSRIEGRGEVFNIGVGHDIRIIELARMLVALTESNSDLVFTNRRIAEVDKLQSDTTKIRARTGWIPQVSLEAGLKENIKWFVDNEIR